MKQKMKQFINQLLLSARHNSVEVILSVFFCIAGCVEYACIWHIDSVLAYFPILFMVSYILNRTTERTRTMRWFYYLSILFFIPFIWIKGDLFSPIYSVSLGVTVLVYLVSCREKKNLPFVRHGLLYIQALSFAFLFSLVVWLLSVSIYYSIQYIFEIWKGRDSLFIVYISYISFMGVLPLLFLMFNQPKATVFEATKLFDILLNYLLSPALLIYAGILYLYFIKVAVLWSLPKGGVAYIVISFVSAAFVLKGCQPLLTRTYYNWFYNRVGLFAIPALLMYWVGTLYRINEYGLTEERVYLLMLGGLLSICAVLFFSKLWGRYLYMAYCAIGILVFFTYIPQVSAHALGVRSQMNRVKEAANTLHIYTPKGSFSTNGNPDAEEDKVYYNTLYQAFNYVSFATNEAFMQQHYGIKSVNELLHSVIPLSMHHYAMYGVNPKPYNLKDIHIEDQDAVVDLAGYRTLQRVSCNWSDKTIYPAYSKTIDSLVVWDRQGSVLLAVDLNVFMEGQLHRAGVVSVDSLKTQEDFLPYIPQLLQYKTDSILFVFDYIDVVEGKGLVVKDIALDFYLKR